MQCQTNGSNAGNILRRESARKEKDFFSFVAVIVDNYDANSITRRHHCCIATTQVATHHAVDFASARFQQAGLQSSLGLLSRFILLCMYDMLRCIIR